MPNKNFDELTWYKDSLQKELKPCPFCGGNDIAIHVPNKEGQEDITCLKCGVKMSKALGVGVIKWWNTRSNIV